MAEIDCNGLDEPCVTWTGGVTRTGPRQYMAPINLVIVVSSIANLYMYMHVLSYLDYINLSS